MYYIQQQVDIVLPALSFFHFRMSLIRMAEIRVPSGAR